MWVVVTETKQGSFKADKNKLLQKKKLRIISRPTLSYSLKCKNILYIPFLPSHIKKIEDLKIPVGKAAREKETRGNGAHASGIINLYF